MKTKLFLGLVWGILCLQPQNAYAQVYLGGTGDGYAKASYTEVSINIFSGGNADGYDKNTVVMLGDTMAFRGGTEDGYAKTNAAMLGDSAAFRGGIEDGYAKNKGAMLGDSTAFRGGVEDGYAKAQGGQTSALTLTATVTNALCINGTGSLTANATLGATPYLYKINSGTNQTSPTFNNLARGSYIVIVTDASGFTASTIAAVNTPTTGVSVSLANNTSPTCALSANGSLTLAANGGVAPYSYSIGGANQTNPTFTNLSATTYTVRATDANGCSATQSLALTAPTAISLATISLTEPTCNGSATGRISLSANGGTPPYSYTINGTNQANGVFNNLTAGIYTVTITDTNGCTQTVARNLSQPTPLIGSYTGYIPCNGDSLAFAVQISGGVSPYIGGNTRRLPAGNYTFPISDANGCTATATATLTTAPRLFVYANVTPLTCLMQTTNVTLTASGGVPPYQGTGSMTAGTGTFTFAIRDNAGCIADTIVTIVRTGANPTADFTYTINNGAVSFTNTSINNLQNTWDFGDASQGSTNTNAAHTYVANGTYTVTLTTQNYCGASSTTQQISISIVATQAAEATDFARVFPNPTENNINIQAHLAKAEELTMTLFDALGRIVLIKNVPKSNILELQLDVFTLPSGIYLLKLETETKRQTVKILKQ